MLPRNSKLAGKIVKSLKGVPKQQRTTAILAMESFYKEHEFINEVSEIESTKMENAVRRIKFPQVKLNEFDEEIMQIISEESSRQFKSIDLIASSNIPIPQMNEVTNLLSNKSSPGFPGKRDFNGDSVIDKVEKLCYKRALDAFSLSHDDWSVNVQTLSGSLANLCTYHSQLKIGETVLSLNTKTGGGHFTHGLVDEHNNGVNLYGQAWNFKHYGLDDNGNINYDEAQEMALKYKPKLIVWGASSHPRDIDYARIRKICDSVGALMMADIAHGFGLVIAGVNKSPFEYADIVTASASKSMRGPRAGLIYNRNKTTNKVNPGVYPGILGAPQNSIIGSLSIAFKYWSTSEYREYVQRVVENCKVLADELKKLGNTIVTGGTETNIMMWDIKNYEFNAETLLDLGEACNINFNGWTSPKAKATGFVGQDLIRFGTNVVSARDYQPDDMRQVARYLNELAHIGSTINKSEAAVWQESIKIEEIAEEVETFATKFPLPGITTDNIF